ncbi:MAG: ATP-grasp domain-containing protein [Ilumatobacteraceae bacterium]
MNVLITCAGRRSYLVDWFRAASAPDGRVVATNSIAESTAMAVADVAVVSPPVTDDGYIEFLLDVCRREDIGLVVPVFDLELPVLAAARTRFAEAGIVVAVSSPKVIAACQDKLATASIAAAAGLTAPRTTLDPQEALAWLDGGVDRVFVKPRHGTGSILTWSTGDRSEVEVLHRKVRRDLASTYVRGDAVVQEALTGIEHGLTVVNDLDGHFQAVPAHRKLAMRAGETDVAETVHDDRLEEAGRALAAAVGHVGALDVDVFVDGATVSLLDLNPRIGGNYPFSHLAGADLPSAYVGWASEEAVPPALLGVRSGVVGLKAIELLALP